MDQDAIWYGGRPQPMQHFVTWDSAPHPWNGAQQPPHFAVHVYFGPCLPWSNSHPFQQLLSSLLYVKPVVFATSRKIWEVTVSSTLPSRTEIQLKLLSFCVQNLTKSKSICSKRCKICNESVVAIIAIQMHQTRFKCESKMMFSDICSNFLFDFDVYFDSST